jgi:gliding motility-associated-like protein
MGSSSGKYNPADGSNTVFYPFHEGLDSYELEIYTRWGELIYRTTDPMIGWDGYVNGTLMPMGVYVWKLKARCSNGRTLVKAGDVTLLR